MNHIQDDLHLVIAFSVHHIVCKEGALNKGVAADEIFQYGSPALQGYLAEGRLRVIQSSLALATNEKQALVRWERLPSYSERD